MFKRFFTGIVTVILLILLIIACAESENTKNEFYYVYKEKTAHIQEAKDSVQGVLTSVMDENVYVEINGETGLKLEEEEWVEFLVDIPGDALYWIDIRYCALPGTVQNIEARLTIDGEVPFIQAEYCALPRIWTDNGEFTKDNNGNELRPGQKEIFAWRNETLYDYNGVTDEEYCFHFTSGTHVIRFQALGDPFLIQNLQLIQPKHPASYQQLKEEYRKKGYNKADVVYLEQQAERDSIRYALYPIAESDYSTPSTVPNNPTKIIYNVVGGEQWVFPDQRIEWEFTVPESGLYQINIKYRQNFSRGLVAYRKILIDHELICEEMRAVEFPFGTDWQNLTVCDGDEPILVWLDKDKPHTVSLAPAIRPMSELLTVLESSVYELNAWYRQILTVTSVNPDTYRDYYLNKEIPGLIDGFQSVSDALKVTAEVFEERLGVSGSELSTMYEAAKQLDDFIERADRIPGRLTEFKSNISSLTDLRRSLMELPMQLDYLSLSSEGYELPDPDCSFWNLISFRLKSFIGSFTEDYNAVGNVYDDSTDYKPIEVWVSANDMSTTGSSSGRDQMTILKQMIDDDFVKETGIPVNVSLVDSSNTLTQAIVAGQGPDVALIIPSGTPVTLAMRGALQDFSEFDLSSIYDEFYESAFVPYEYDGGLYALPETQTFSMLYYRTDVFEDLGISVPETWDDFYKIIPIIQKQNLQIGFGEDLSLYAMFLMQNGGKYFNEDLSATGFDTPSGIAAFKQWTDLYTKYSFPLYFDAFNRFRTGEIPIMIQGIGFYNQLEAAAPELKGLWAMAPIPGVLQGDGVNRCQPSYGTACIMLSNLPNKDDAFKFLKWWVSADVQAEFGNRLEGTLGVAARYPTANKVAFESLPWSIDERKAIQKQWELVSAIENIPGGYYITRSLTNAFRRVVYYYENPREVLLRYNEDMNLEIHRKRIEYGLE